jgi:fructose-1,6-bisphosphatase
VDQELFKIICSTAAACIDVSQELQSLPIQKYVQKSEDKEIKVNIQGEKQKEMDVISNEIFIDRIRDTVVVMASEEEEYVIKGELWDDFHAEKNDYIGYEIAFDPLDGSSNLDVNVPTG